MPMAKRTMASAGPIRREHSPDGGVLGLCMKPPKRSIGRCDSHRITPAAWLSDSSSKALLCFTLLIIEYLKINKLLYQLIDSIKLLWPPPPPTPHPRRVYAGLVITVKSAPLEAAEAHHGGDFFVLCEFFIVFSFPPEPIWVKLLRNCKKHYLIPATVCRNIPKSEK